jgi:hypothetical protein
MDEQKEAQSLASKPLKSVNHDRPDLVVAREKGGEADSSSSPCAVATVPAQAEQRAVSVAAPPITTPKTPHPASISNIATPTAKVPPRNSASVKKPMTPRRFITFVCGLFIAGMAGSLSNGLITAVTETAFAPQYVKDFYKAAALQDRAKAFYGMHLALSKGQNLEPLSRRFTKLTVSLADQLDNDGRYLEAKTEWAKAALPSEVASPEFRERKRSYLIDEAESEHLGFLSELSNGVDEDVLKEVEEAADIFQKSEVTHHGLRAVNAFIAAGQLAADRKDFERARDDFASADMIANAQWQNGGSLRLNLLAARWEAELQETIAALLSSKNKSASHPQFIASDLTVENRLALERDVHAKNWDKLDSTFANAERRHLQGFDGDTIVSDMYSVIGTPSEAFGHNRGRLHLLREWADARPHSVRPLVALAYWFNARAEAFAFTVEHKNSTVRMRAGGLVRAQRALAYLQKAASDSPAVAFEPSFIKALQANAAIGGRLSSWSNWHTKLVSDLQSASIAIIGDDAQFNLDQISEEVLAEPQALGATDSLLKRAADQANRIGGDAGDEFYARAVSRTGASPTSKFLDTTRLIKGSSLLAKKFGTPKSSSH